MKKLILTAGLLFAGLTSIFAQKYITRTGKIIFDATTPSSPEKISAVNNEVANIFDSKTGEIIFQAPIKSFKFASELMQEHFNENYMESDKFLKADLKGTITNISEINFSKDGSYTAKVSGKLTIHGVTREVTETGTAIVKGNTVILKARFIARLADYNISIPSLVADKVAKEATITLESTLTQK